MNSNLRSFAKVYYALALLALIIAIGTAGYTAIEGWGVFESFYMTIITMSTVGFKEVHELSWSGQAFTAFLIISSFGTFMYAISSLTTYVVGGEYRRYLKQIKVMQKVAKMENHVVICGFGRVGRQVAEDLESRGEKFVVVELDSERVSLGKDKYGYFMIQGNSTNDEVLSEANINNARAIITCLPNDADNVYVVLAAREVKRKILIVSRASSSGAVSKLKMAGATNIIMPDSLGGSHMASLITNPDVMEFLDIIRIPGYKGVNIESISYDELPPNLQGSSIEKLTESKGTEVSVIGFKGPDGEYVINPDSSIEIIPGSRIFVLGSEEQIKTWVLHFQVSHG